MFLPYIDKLINALNDDEPREEKGDLVLQYPFTSTRPVICAEDKNRMIKLSKVIKIMCELESPEAVWKEILPYLQQNEHKMSWTVLGLFQYLFLKQFTTYWSRYLLPDVVKFLFRDFIHDQQLLVHIQLFDNIAKYYPKDDKITAYIDTVETLNILLVHVPIVSVNLHVFMEWYKHRFDCKRRQAPVELIKYWIKGLEILPSQTSTSVSNKKVLEQFLLKLEALWEDAFSVQINGITSCKDEAVHRFAFSI